MTLFGRDDLQAGKSFSSRLRSFPDEIGANAQLAGADAKIFFSECKPVTERARHLRYTAYR
jgi:hypothetical protein